MNDYDALVQKCEGDPECQHARHNEANIMPITASEKMRWEGVPVRRCPACLDGTPSRCEACLQCRATFLCRPTQRTDEKPEAERGQEGPSRPSTKAQPKARPPVFVPEPPTSAPSQQGASASASAPAEEDGTVTKLKLPELPGVTWKKYIYKKEE